MPTRRSRTARRDDASLTIHMLDMGREQYGDCVVIERGDHHILIDGGHRGDWQGRNGFPSIPDQLAEILGHASPFRFDLLVVTHCHSDHIGCLPTLVEKGIIKADHALVADDRLGFGRGGDYVPPDAPSSADLLVAAMREEDYSGLPDQELQAFLQDAATIEQSYRAMLDQLEADGTQLVRYGRDDHSSVERALANFGLKVLGPTKDQLVVAAEAIARFNEDARTVAADLGGIDDPAQLVRVYRSMIRSADAEGGEDRPGKGAAINDQSIVVRVGGEEFRALLGGDMQFAKPEVAGLAPHMQQLRETVRAAGPFQFIKMSHHASYNGFDESLLRDWSDTHYFACSNGTNDATHPDSGVLRLLEGEGTSIHWARTDRNGRIAVTLSNGKPRFTISRGELNDFTPNGDVASPPVESEEEGASPLSWRQGVTVEDQGLREVSAVAKLGHGVRRVTITFEVPQASEVQLPKDWPMRSSSEKGPSRPKVIASRPILETRKLGGGRALPKLLFVTHVPQLESNLGRIESQTVLSMIRTAGQIVLEVRNPSDPYPEIRSALAKDFMGVVILGGLDVLPSRRVDVLPPSLRTQLGTRTSDADNFVVWSDSSYGDRDGDLLPEVPVTRIPDARSPKLVQNALAAGDSRMAGSRFGIRNSARPFAAPIYALLKGLGPLLVSEPATAAAVGAGAANALNSYLMLHGSDMDATRFWGEDAGGTVEAFNLGNVPREASGVVFTGCCWGALTVQTTAANFTSGQPLGARTPGASIALSFLQAGATAFIGCTGTHYSPSEPPYRYFGGPMHDAFWKCYNQRMAPAEALFRAKIEYLRDLPHGENSPLGQAIEFKILRQYTCLGLGW